MDPKRLVIIDGYSLLFRAFYGTRYLSTSDGRPTNALFGLVGMLFYVLEKQRPTAMLVALDAPGKTFRHAEFAEYKGTRRDTPEELKVQFPVARDLMAALGIPSLELTGFEADDIVGTVSRKAEENGYHTTIITGDLDALQLVDPCVSVMTPKVGVTEVAVYGVQEVMERYGFGPALVPDYKAIVGDKSDNIPGVPGIGDKGASELIKRFGTVEQMLANLEQVEPKYRNKIEPNKDQLIKSKWLATIDCDAPVEYDFKPFVLTNEQMEAAKAMLENLEMRNHLRKVPTVLGPYLSGYEAPASADAPSVEVLSEAVEFENVGEIRDLAAFVGESRFALAMPPGPSQPSMFEGADAAYAAVAVGGKSGRAPMPVVLEWFARHADRSVTHDSKAWYALARKAGHPLLIAPGFDTMLAGYVLQSGRSNYVLRDLVQGYLEAQPPESPEQQAAALVALEPVMRARLDKEEQTAVLDEIEQPLVPILAEMEGFGIRVSRDFLMDFSKSLEVTIDQSARLIYEHAGSQFLIGSPKQLGEVLFEKLGIPGSKKTKTGYATGAEILQVLAAEHPICAEVLTWRELTKLKSTYADSLPKMLAADGRIHTSFNQTVAATGRLSSNEPNLQNIPIRTDLGRQIRKAFVADPGWCLGSFDYSQIELRLLAHLCKDDALVDAFQKRVDVHTVTAALMFGLGESDVTKEQRRLAKMLNYAVLYGVTDFGLANQLGAGFSVSEAKALIAQYFERFPSVKRFTESVIEEARRKGFTATLKGRRRYFPEIHAANRNERLYAERQAVNAPIQGAAADMIKLAMIDVRKRLGQSPVRMLLQVHDELVFEMPEADESLVQPLREAMENAMPLDVPVEVDAKLGANWNEMTPVV